MEWFFLGKEGFFYLGWERLPWILGFPRIFWGKKAGFGSGFWEFGRVYPGKIQNVGAWSPEFGENWEILLKALTLFQGLRSPLDPHSCFSREFRAWSSLGFKEGEPGGGWKIPFSSRAWKCWNSGCSQWEFQAEGPPRPSLGIPLIFHGQNSSYSLSSPSFPPSLFLFFLLFSS